jgi:hypothetical protein
MGLGGKLSRVADLVGCGVGVGPSLERGLQSCRASSKSGTGDAEGVHDDWYYQLRMFVTECSFTMGVKCKPAE